MREIIRSKSGRDLKALLRLSCRARESLSSSMASSRLLMSCADRRGWQTHLFEGKVWSFSTQSHKYKTISFYRLNKRFPNGVTHLLSRLNRLPWSPPPLPPVSKISRLSRVWPSRMSDPECFTGLYRCRLAAETSSLSNFNYFFGRGVKRGKSNVYPPRGLYRSKIRNEPTKRSHEHIILINLLESVRHSRCRSGRAIFFLHNDIIVIAALTSTILEISSLFDFNTSTIGIPKLFFRYQIIDTGIIQWIPH